MLQEIICDAEDACHNTMGVPRCIQLQLQYRCEVQADHGNVQDFDAK